MKSMLILVALVSLAGCVSAKKREECKVTCMTCNTNYQTVNDLGCVCKEKANPDTDRNYKSN